MKKMLLVFATAGLVALTTTPAAAQDTSMSFFVTSVGSGNGADLGGLSGADQHCQMLAAAVGAGDRTWHAYLSTTGPDGGNARDRIGSGPWYNVKGELIAANVAALHTEDANINNDTALDENGGVINAEGQPSRHDILTGSQTDGTAADWTCQNWTSSGESGAVLGHHDRLMFATGKPGSPWNSAHNSRGCSQDNLRGTGGAGLTYCFATD